MKTFEKFLEEDVWEPEGVLDDDMPDAFESWLVGQDIDEIINWADMYGKLQFTEGQKIGIVQGGELTLGTQKMLREEIKGNELDIACGIALKELKRNQ